MTTPRIVEIRQGILKKNDQIARELRRRFRSAGVFVVNLVSSPGAGKTALLEHTLVGLHKVGYASAALIGDLATDNDARRLAAHGAPVKQINTGTTCHLEAEMVARALEGWPLEQLDFLFIENVGNLVCPASYDLGESLRAVLFAVTEGEDKPGKYPPLFHSADVVVFTKMDLADAVDFQRERALEYLRRVNPHVPVLETSARTGKGIARWLEWLIDRKKQHGQAPAR